MPGSATRNIRNIFQIFMIFYFCCGGCYLERIIDFGADMADEARGEGSCVQKGMSRASTIRREDEKQTKRSLLTRCYYAD